MLVSISNPKFDLKTKEWFITLHRKTKYGEETDSKIRGEDYISIKEMYNEYKQIMKINSLAQKQKQR